MPFFLLILLAVWAVNMRHSVTAQGDWNNNQDQWRQTREQIREQARAAREQARLARDQAREQARAARDQVRNQQNWNRQNWNGQDWQAQGWNRQGRNDGAHVRFGRDYNLPAGETVSGPIVVVGGSATVDGQASEDLVVIGGNVKLGPTASVGGDVVAVGGHTDIDPKAQVSGEVTDIAATMPTMALPWMSWSDRWWRVLTMSFTAIRLFGTAFAAVMLTLIFPQSIGRVARRIASGPASSVMLGLGTQILFVPILGAVALALVVSVIGIPLVVMLPFVVLLTGGLWLSGFAAVAARVGAAIRGSQVSDEPAVADAFAGVVALVALSVVGQLLTLGPAWMGPIGILLHVVGLCVEYVAWTVGMGAAIAALFGRRTERRPISSTLVTLPS